MKRSNIFISLVVIVLILGAAIGFLAARGSDSNKVRSNPDVACTEEAKLCPDGSGVGRQGPNCEFPDCPTEVPAVKP
jgi:hypothetical protein